MALELIHQFNLSLQGDLYGGLNVYVREVTNFSTQNIYCSTADELTNYDNGTELINYLNSPISDLSNIRIKSPIYSKVIMYIWFTPIMVIISACC